jgi:hypothetical protein
METSRMEQVLSVETRPDEPEVDISIEEFDKYCRLFEEMLDEFERKDEMLRGSLRAVEINRWSETSVPDLESHLDEFDYAEIRQMRKRFGIKTQSDDAAGN